MQSGDKPKSWGDQAVEFDWNEEFTNFRAEVRKFADELERSELGQRIL